MGKPVSRPSCDRGAWQPVNPNFCFEVLNSLPSASFGSGVDCSSVADKERNGADMLVWTALTGWLRSSNVQAVTTAHIL